MPLRLSLKYVDKGVPDFNGFSQFLICCIRISIIIIVIIIIIISVVIIIIVITIVIIIIIIEYVNWGFRKCCLHYFLVLQG